MTARSSFNQGRKEGRKGEGPGSSKAAGCFCSPRAPPRLVAPRKICGCRKGISSGSGLVRNRRQLAHRRVIGEGGSVNFPVAALPGLAAPAASQARRELLCSSSRQHTKQARRRNVVSDSISGCWAFLPSLIKIHRAELAAGFPDRCHEGGTGSTCTLGIDWPVCN